MSDEDLEYRLTNNYSILFWPFIDYTTLLFELYPKHTYSLKFANVNNTKQLSK